MYQTEHDAEIAAKTFAAALPFWRIETWNQGGFWRFRLARGPIMVMQSEGGWIALISRDPVAAGTGCGIWTDLSLKSVNSPEEAIRQAISAFQEKIYDFLEVDFAVWQILEDMA